jgi:hypothetical protein
LGKLVPKKEKTIKKTARKKQKKKEKEKKEKPRHEKKVNCAAWGCMCQVK